MDYEVWDEVNVDDEYITVGKPITTQKSGIVGIVREIHDVPNHPFLFRLRLDVNGETRWTTYELGLEKFDEE